MNTPLYGSALHHAGRTHSQAHVFFGRVRGFAALRSEQRVGRGSHLAKVSERKREREERERERREREREKERERKRERGGGGGGRKEPHPSAAACSGASNDANWRPK
jgi:hypothetical protein